MRKKKNLVCVLIALPAALIVCSAVMWGAMCHKPQTPQEESQGSGTDQTVDSGESITPAESDDPLISSIFPVERGTTDLGKNRGDVDVSNMTRNPDAEVVNSQIEYETKEVGANAE